MAKSRRQRGGRSEVQLLTKKSRRNRSSVVQLLSPPPITRSRLNHRSLQNNLERTIKRILSTTNRKHLEILKKIKLLCIHKKFPRVSPEGGCVVLFSDPNRKDTDIQSVIMITIHSYMPMEIEERTNSIATLLDTDGILSEYNKQLKRDHPILKLLTNYVPVCA